MIYVAQCKGHLVPHMQGKSILCCNRTNLCNMFLQPEPVRSGTTPRPTLGYDDSIPYIALIISITVCLIAFLIIVACVYLRYRVHQYYCPDSSCMYEPSINIENLEFNPLLPDGTYKYMCRLYTGSSDIKTYLGYIAI